MFKCSEKNCGRQLCLPALAPASPPLSEEGHTHTKKHSAVSQAPNQGVTPKCCRVETHQRKALEHACMFPMKENPLNYLLLPRFAKSKAAGDAAPCGTPLHPSRTQDAPQNHDPRDPTDPTDTPSNVTNFLLDLEPVLFPASTAPWLYLRRQIGLFNTRGRAHVFFFLSSRIWRVK